VGKCDLCNSLLKTGGSPACTSACPTGALNYGTLHDTRSYITSVFTDSKLNPALEIKGISERIPLKIIPERSPITEKSTKYENESRLKGEWSLIIFTFLTTLAVSIVSSSLLKGIFPELILFFAVILLSGLSSLLHPGKPFRAWRSLSNIRHSPLSREIVIFLIFCLTSTLAILLNNNILQITASLTGLLLLIAVDNVYSFSDNRKIQFFHSGQTFLTGLLMISYFSGMTVSFMFIGAIKILLTVLKLFSTWKPDRFLPLRFFNIAVLLLLVIANLTGQLSFDPVLVFLLIMGEFAGRIIFYIDFNPVNIQKVIKNFNKNSI
jgi:DMSO reductase anchor subunit